MKKRLLPLMAVGMFCCSAVLSMESERFQSDDQLIGEFSAMFEPMKHTANIDKIDIKGVKLTDSSYDIAADIKMDYNKSHKALIENISKDNEDLSEITPQYIINVFSAMFEPMKRTANIDKIDIKGVKLTDSGYDIAADIKMDYNKSHKALIENISKSIGDLIDITPQSVINSFSDMLVCASKKCPVNIDEISIENIGFFDDNCDIEANIKMDYNKNLVKNISKDNEDLSKIAPQSVINAFSDMLVCASKKCPANIGEINIENIGFFDDNCEIEANIKMGYK